MATEWYHNYSEEIGDLVAGTFGGVSGIVVGSPFDIVKVRVQNAMGRSNPLVTAAHILKNEGPLAFWKGILPPVVSNVPINAVGFATYGQAQRFLTPIFDGKDNYEKRSIVPQTPMEQQCDFFTKELLSNYTLPSSFINQNGNSTKYDLEVKFAQFQSQSTTYSTIAQNVVAPNWTAVFFAACWSGFLSCLFAAPSELLKIQQQTTVGATPSTASVAKKLMAEANGSPWALFRGFWVTVLRDSPSLGVYFGCYEVVRWIFSYDKYTPQVLVDGKIITPEQSREIFANDMNNNAKITINWQHSNDVDAWVSLLGGSIAGPASWAATYPFDIAKTRYQSLSWSEAKKTSTLRILRDIIRESGYKGLTTGLGTTLVRAVPVNAVTFLFYEKTLQFWRKNKILSPPSNNHHI